MLVWDLDIVRHPSGGNREPLGASLVYIQDRAEVKLIMYRGYLKFLSLIHI